MQDRAGGFGFGHVGRGCGFGRAGLCMRGGLVRGFGRVVRAAWAVQGMCTSLHDSPFA